MRETPANPAKKNEKNLQAAVLAVLVPVSPP